MFSTPRFTQQHAWLLLLPLALGACENKETQQKLQQLTIVSAEKDSLLMQVAENTRLMTEISAELANVRDANRPGETVVVSPESPLETAVNRESILAKIKDVSARVNQSEERLRASQRRIRGLTAVSDSLKSDIARFETMVGDFQQIIADQKATIASLNEQVMRLETENVQLATAKAALTDTVADLREFESTVYYVVGTKDELMERGIVAEEGGKFLFFGKKALVPARDLNAADFTAIDKWQVEEIPLPNAEKDYKIASRHDLALLDPQPEKDGKVRGTIHITAPDVFWASSKFLIIVES